MKQLANKITLVVGVANSHSIAAGCAQAFSDAGSEIVMTYVNEKAKPHVQPVADAVGAKILMPMDVEANGQMDAVFKSIKNRWGRLDVLVHSIAFCPTKDLQGRVVDCSQTGFARAMDISVHSLIRMARLAEPLMTHGGTILTITYYGGEKVVDYYNIMGPVKAALEGTMRALAVELGPKGIRVNAISPAPIKTRAASGIAHCSDLIDTTRARAPTKTVVTIKDVGDVAVMLSSDGMHNVTGDVTYVDGGLHVLA
jgi:enoyl-[acyl-carrier protein] reductase I